MHAGTINFKMVAPKVQAGHFYTQGGWTVPWVLHLVFPLEALSNVHDAMVLGTYGNQP